MSYAVCNLEPEARISDTYLKIHCPACLLGHQATAKMARKVSCKKVEMKMFTKIE